MVKKVNLGSTKRYGTRYGPRNKEKMAILEKGHRGRHKCPFCNYNKVVRLSSRGIWQCKKCNTKFSGKAYTFEQTSKAIITAPVTEEEETKTEEEFVEETDDKTEVA